MAPEPRIPTAIAGLETFTLSDPRGEEEEEDLSVPDAESFFNLPNDDEDDEDEDDPRPPLGGEAFDRRGAPAFEDVGGRQKAAGTEDEEHDLDPDRFLAAPDVAEARHRVQEGGMEAAQPRRLHGHRTLRHLLARLILHRGASGMGEKAVLGRLFLSWSP
jgi:hypothetical protein